MVWNDYDWVFLFSHIIWAKGIKSSPSSKQSFPTWKIYCNSFSKAQMIQALRLEDQNWPAKGVLRPRLRCPSDPLTLIMEKKGKKGRQKSAVAESGPTHTSLPAKASKIRKVPAQNCCFSPSETWSYLYKESVIQYGITPLTRCGVGLLQVCSRAAAKLDLDSSAPESHFSV